MHIKDIQSKIKNSNNNIEYLIMEKNNIITIDRDAEVVARRLLII